MGLSDIPARHAFICYSPADTAAADRIQSALENAGVRVWRDTTMISPGQDWRAVIRQAISEGAIAFLACFSGEGLATERSLAHEELLWAVDEMRQRNPVVPWLIPVRLDDCEIPDIGIGAGRTLRSLQSADLFGAGQDEHLARLVTAVKAILGSSRPLSPPMAVGASPPAVGKSKPRARILFLAANPVRTPRLALDEEYRQIGQKIRFASGPDLFELIGCWAVRPDDLIQALNEHRPHIVQFSGHGSPDGQIYLAGEGGRSRPVSANALERLFASPSLTGETRIVFLNACFTTAQAQAIGKTIDYVIGMPAAVGDQAARTFAANFYRALAFGLDVTAAFDQASVAIVLEGLSGPAEPALLVRPGARPWTAVRS